MKTLSPFVVLLLCLAAGCASRHPAKPASAAAAPVKASAKFEAADDFKIEVAVYTYLLQKHPWGDGPYAAIFLGGGAERVAALAKRLPRQVVPFRSGDRVQLRPGQTPLDRDTGKPALVVNAKAMEPTNGVSEAVGSWYGGGDVSGLYAFVLVETDGQWAIQSVK